MDEGFARGAHPLVVFGHAPVVRDPCECSLDGLIAKDKFCMSRRGRLSLRRSRRLASARRSQISEPFDGPAYPPAEITQHGGADEASVAGPETDRAMPGRSGTLGPGIPEHPAVEPGSRTGIRSERERQGGVPCG